MTHDRAIFIIQTERECLKRTGCDRDCENCDLVMPDEDIEEAYKMAIESLKGDDGR